MPAAIKSPRTFLIIAAILQIVWGFVPTASKLVISEIPVELYIAIRWSISGLIFAAYLSLFQKWQKIPLKDAAAISALGLLGYGLASFGTLYGLKIGGVINFSLVTAIGPVITSVIAVIFLRERPKKMFYVAISLSVLGLILLALGKYQVSSFSVMGTSMALIIGACFLEAIIFIFSKKFKTKVSSAQYLAIAQLSSATLMWLLQATTFQQTQSLQNLSINGIAAALFVSIVACVLCYLVLYWLLNFIDGHRLALFEGLHAVSATAFGIIFFSEPLMPLMIAGGALILTGLTLGNLPLHAVQENPE